MLAIYSLSKTRARELRKLPSEIKKVRKVCGFILEIW